MFKENPFTGVGISNYQFACLNYESYKKQMINYNCASHPHNIYIQIFAETGLIGAFFLMLKNLAKIYFIILKQEKVEAIFQN